MEDVIQVHDQFYILATASRAAQPTAVLKHDDTFALFDTVGDVGAFVAGEHAIAVAERNIRIRQVGAEQFVVVLDARAQQQWPLPVQPEAKSRQVARSLVVEALLAGAEHADIAVQREDRERVGVLQHRRPLADARGGCQDVELIVDLNYVFHEAVVSTPTEGSTPDRARSYRSM